MGRQKMTDKAQTGKVMIFKYGRCISLFAVKLKDEFFLKDCIQSYHRRDSLPKSISIRHSADGIFSMVWQKPKEGRCFAHPHSNLWELNEDTLQGNKPCYQILLLEDESPIQQTPQYNNSGQEQRQMMQQKKQNQETEEDHINAEEYDALPWADILALSRDSEESSSTKIQMIDERIKDMQQLCRETNAQLVALQRESQTKSYKQLAERIRELDNMMYHMGRHLKKGKFFENLKVYRKRISATLCAFGIEEITPRDGDDYDPKIHITKSGLKGQIVRECLLPGFQMRLAEEAGNEVLLEAFISVH